MYPKYFGLSEPSFSITPDPHYLFLSEQHREALAHLLYGASETGGFVLLTGEVGTGKTTVCRAFLEQLPEGVEVGLVLNPALTGIELMTAVCQEFGVALPPGERSTKMMLDRLNSYLLDCHARGRRPVLIIDEAQNLRPVVLEQVRLLTNLETPKHKLLQIFLVGQPELRTLLASNELRQLNQRITARFHLLPLSLKETSAYIRHRLAVAGVERPLFSRAALRRIQHHSGGVPRLINLICDRALLGTAVSHRLLASAAIVDKAAREVRGNDSSHPWPRRAWPSIVLAAAVAALAGLWIGGSDWLPLPWTLDQEHLTERALAREDVGERPDAGGQQSAQASIQQAGGEMVASAGPDAPRSVDGGVAIGSDSRVSADLIGGQKADAGTGPSDPRRQHPLPADPWEQHQEIADRAPDDLAPDDLAPDDLAPDPRGASENPGDAPAEASNETTAQAPAEATLSGASGKASGGRRTDSDARPRLSRIGAERVAETESPPLNSLLHQPKRALQSLLSAWDLAFPEDETLNCDTISVVSLACERGQGRWSDLRRFDRPVALQLALADGSQGDVVVVGLNEEYARVAGEDGEVSAAVPIAEIDQRWSGDYLILWRLPPSGDRVIGRAARPASVHWLRDRLRAWPGGDPRLPDGDEYDAALMTQVRAFQSAHGLETDGIAGPHTLILLANALMSATDEEATGQEP